MYKKWTGVPKSNHAAASSDQTTKGQPSLDWRESGVAGRNARSFAHDSVVIQRQQGEIAGVLLTSPLFSGLSPVAELELCDTAIERTFSNRKIMFREDDPVRFVDIIVRGSVKITQLSPDGDEVILRIERTGSPIDGMGEMSEKNHSTTAWAISDCVVLSWDASVFANFAHKFPVIQRNATTIMARRLKALSESFCDLSTARVPQRLARVLLRLSGEEAALHEPLGLSREELAQMTGTSLFTTSRLLREWAELDIVHVNRRGLLIEDLSALTRLSQDGGGTEQQEFSAPPRGRRKVWGASPLIHEIDELSDGTYDL